MASDTGLAYSWIARSLREAGGEIKRGKAGTMTGAKPHFIVFANEKGGTGKSTTAVHSAVALAAAGRTVAALDLDSRQRTLGRYLDNRAASIKRLGVALPMPSYETFDPAKGESLQDQIARLSEGAEVVVIDTPGRDDPHAREAMLSADTLVTPINDSFVDLDLIGEVDAETYKVRRPSFYAELVWNSRTQKAKATGSSVDWVVLRNRLQHVEAKNMRRVGAALDELSRRVGFRVIPGLGERVIYRELFPKGLTLLDLAQLGNVGISHIAARQELREMIAGLGLPDEDREPAPLRAAAGG
jgi:chromosome partitioning protein